MACWENSKSAPTKRYTPRHLVGSCCVTPVSAFAWEPSWEPFAVDLCGRLWTAVDGCGIESLSFRAERTPVDPCGHGL